MTGRIVGMILDVCMKWVDNWVTVRVIDSWGQIVERCLVPGLPQRAVEEIYRRWYDFAKLGVKAASPLTIKCEDCSLRLGGMVKND